jgi:5'-nucleotidase
LDYALNADFAPAKKIIKSICKNILKNGLPPGTLLNVNIPAVSEKEIKGIKICRQANAKWDEEFDERTDPNKRKYYWLTGKFVNHDKGEDTDEWALANNFVSVVPVQFDFTAHHAIQFLNDWKF